MIRDVISHAKQLWNEQRGQKLARALVRRGFQSGYFPNKEVAKDYIYGLIPHQASVGLGGSATIRQMGLVEELKDKFTEVYDHWEEGLSPEEMGNIRKKQLTCDVFITSTNAVTIDGRLVNTDASGNRAAAMIFGPGKIIVVLGVNKIVRNVEEALQRIKTIAPLNFLRANEMNYKGSKINAPCLVDGGCRDCWPPERHCRVTTIIEGIPKASSQYHIVIIGEDLGY